MKNFISYFLISFVLGISVYYLYSLHFQTYQGKTAQEWAEIANSNKAPADKLATSEANEQSFSSLDIPIDSFPLNDLRHGSAVKGDGNKMSDYTEGDVAGLAMYQSYPTTKTTVDLYSSETKPLKSLTPDQTRQEITKIVFYNQPKAEDSYKEFGILDTNYLPSNYITSVSKLDVDGDGVPETIISYNGTEFADGGSNNSDIIKGNNIIFSVQEDNARIVPADTTNGFFVEWGSLGNGGRCCSEGFMRTRFILKDGKFIPIYEQVVRYLKIGKE